MSLRKSLFWVFGASLIYGIIFYSLAFIQNITTHSRGTIKLILANGYLWIPGLFALYFMRKENMKVSVVCGLSKRVLQALFIPVVFTLIGTLVSLLFANFSLERMVGAAEMFGIRQDSEIISTLLVMTCMLVVSILTSLSFNFVCALGEELFWRGFLWEKMKCLGFWKASVHIGFLSSLWLVPNVVFFGYLFPKDPLIGSFLILSFNMALTPLLLYFREKESSVMSATIFRAMMQSFCPFAVAFFPESNPIYVAPLGIAGVLSIWMIAAVFFATKAKESEINVKELRAP